MAPNGCILLTLPIRSPSLLPQSLHHVRPRPQTSPLRIQQLRSFGIKSIDRPHPNRFNHHPNLPSLLATRTAALTRLQNANTLPVRPGALATKSGMTAIFDVTTGERIPCTVLQLDRVQVVAHKTRKQHGYDAVCVGSGHQLARRIAKPQMGEFSERGIPPKRTQREFRVKGVEGLIPVGTEIKPSYFQVGQFVDARSTTKGKGFQGVMKRWGFHGQDRSHGVSLTHRSMGSAGQGQGGGSRVYPGKKMAGNMGNVRNTIQNCKILQVDEEKGIVVVKGAVSGPKGCMVIIQDAIKKPWPDSPAMPRYAQEVVPEAAIPLETQALEAVLT
jgi:large subunit ribosomal protein L3